MSDNARNLHARILNQSAVGQQLTDFFERFGVEYDYHSSGYSYLAGERRESITRSSLKSLLILWIKCSPQELDATISIWTDIQRQKHLAEKKAEVTAMMIETSTTPGAQERADAEVKKWIGAVCEDGHDLSEIVMRHWIWTVKRHLVHLPVTDPICPVLFGKSRGGKSMAVAALLNPLKSLVTNMDIAQITDSRTWGSFRDSYVVYIDELAGASKVNVETLKMLITTDVLAYRPLYSNEVEKVYPHVSLIGTSNRKIADVIKDPTSGARYWELRCRDQLDWCAINSIDYPLLWSCISASDISPMQGLRRAEILKLQHDKLRVIDPVESWLGDINMEPGDTWIPVKDLYINYKAWAIETGHTIMNTTTFGIATSNLKYRKMNRYGAKCVAVKSGESVYGGVTQASLIIAKSLKDFKNYRIAKANQST